jgi:hypothetical protein
MSQIIPIYIPTYISDQNYNPSRVLPRLFFYNGLVDCEQYYIESGSVNQYGISQAQTAFPYFDNYNVVSGSFPTETSRTLLFNNEAPSYGAAPTASLYTEYWEDYISLLYNPRTRLLNCSAIIPLADYVKMELNDVVNFRGNYYHLRAINDYSLKDGTCSLQLLGPIISDTLSGPPLPPPTYSIDYLVVAGGGGGGTGTGGGGGAGGLKSGSFTITNSQTIPVVVGLGGAAGANGQSSSISSSFSGFISASGGGYGGYGTSLSPNGTGSVGGSGGGGTGGVINTIISGSLGTSAEGTNGGAGTEVATRNQNGGGGGGASQSGSSYSPAQLIGGAGAGGSGSFWLNGIAYAGGGGGWYSSSLYQAGGEGGIGGGGRGAAIGSPSLVAVTGSVNTGGGGGGGDSTGTYIAKGGGSGVVILRYSSSFGQIGNGGQVLNSGSFIYHTFTGSANFTT